nr:VWA domain protein interacting with AAA ATPase [Candidatus Pantoea persica]
MLRDVPRWKAETNAELKATPVSATLASEFELFQRVQLLGHRDFSQRLPEILTSLAQLPSPFIDEAHRLLQHTDAHALSGAQHTLFLQHWRLSLTLQTLTLNEQLLEQQRERLMAELQQRMALSGQLAPMLSDVNEAAAGRLWDMSKAPLQHGDY